MFGDSGHLRHSAVLRTSPLGSLNSCGSLRWEAERGKIRKI